MMEFKSAYDVLRYMLVSGKAIEVSNNFAYRMVIQYDSNFNLESKITIFKSISWIKKSVKHASVLELIELLLELEGVTL